MSSNWKYGLPFIAKVYEASPDGMLHRIMKENPGAAEEDTWPIWRAELVKNGAALDAVLRCYHVNAHRRVERLVSRAGLPGKRRAAAREERDARVAATFVRVKKALILDHVMPNGLLLRDCTFGYATAIGDVYARIGAKGDPNAIIGQVLSNAEADAAVGEIGPNRVDQRLNGNGKAVRPQQRIGAAILRAAGQQFGRWGIGANRDA
jgi:hypothetical protein